MLHKNRDKEIKTRNMVRTEMQMNKSVTLSIEVD
jgi:hypothetical protein